MAESVEYILANLGEIETGTRVIVEKEALVNESYRPEKLWVYDVNTKKIVKVKTSV